MHIYRAEYSHIYLYMQPECTWEVQKIHSQSIHTQESGAHYTKMTQLWCSTINFYAQGWSASLDTQLHGNIAE